MAEDTNKDDEIFDDPFEDEEEDIILKTRMKLYDLFMGNWRKLLYGLGGILIGTLAYGLYESAQEEALQRNSKRLAVALDPGLQQKNQPLLNYSSLYLDYMRLVEVSKTNNMSFAQRNKLSEMSVELRDSITLMSDLDSAFPLATFLQPNPVGRSILYANSYVGKALTTTTPSMKEVSEKRNAAADLESVIEELEGATKIYGYVQLALLWTEVNEDTAAVNALETALSLELNETQEWMVRSVLSQVKLAGEKHDEAIAVLDAYIQKYPATNFFVEYAIYNKAMLQESKGDKEASLQTLDTIVGTRFVEEIAALRNRLAPQ